MLNYITNALGLGNKSTNADLSLVHQDYKDFLLAVNKYEEKQAQHRARRLAGEDVDPIGIYSFEIEATRKRQGVNWFNDRREESDTSKGFANPSDYPRIRDNRKALNKFITSIIDMPPHWVGHGGHGDNREIIYPAEYVNWLYHFSSYEPFKRAVEEITLSLAIENFAQNFELPDIAKYREKIVASNIRINFINDHTLSSALCRLGIEYNCHVSDQAFKTKLITALKSTERPITLLEVLTTYAGERETLIAEFEKGNFKEVLYIHAEEMSPEMKRELREWQINKLARTQAEEDYSPQLVRIMALLRLIAEIGNPNNVLSGLYQPLMSRLSAGYLGDITYNHNFVELNPFITLAVATAAVKPKDHPLDAWLAIIDRTKDSRTALALVRTVLYRQDRSETSNTFISKLLGITKRNFPDKNLSHVRQIAGFIDEISFGDELSRIISKHLDPEYTSAAYFDTEDFSIGIAKLQFQGELPTLHLQRWTESGNKSGLYCHNPLTGEFTCSDPALLTLANKHLSMEGMPITPDTFVTSFESRKIGANSKLFKGLDSESATAYEGIIGINSFHLYFTYDATSQKTMFAIPYLNEGCTFFRKRTSADEKKVGFDNPENMINATELVPSDKFAARVEEQAKSSRKQGFLGAPVYSLEYGLKSTNIDRIVAYLEAQLRL